MPRRLRDSWQIMIRADEALYDAIETVGQRWGFIKPDGEVNMSRTTVVLLREYLSDHDPGIITGSATETAKLALYKEMREHFIWHVEQLRQELMALTVDE